LTHAAARLMYGDDTIPAEAGTQQAADYEQAIADDVANMHLLNTNDPAEQEVSRLFSERMRDYARRAPAQGKHPDTKLLQEFLVGVPQLIADCGEATVERFAPNLLAYFKDFSQKIQAKVTTDPR